ncbi:MAG: hypothetical protein HYZ20_01550, partial [Burkholderiales bacterium]|nr:hypothetical protein [Burkholderiales bacterium]
MIDAGEDVDLGARSADELRSARDRLSTPVLVAAGVLALLALLVLARAIAVLPGIDARWQVGPAGELRLAASADPALAALAGARLLALEAGGRMLPADPAWLRSAPRWNADEQARRTMVQSRRALAELLRTPRVTLRMDDGRAVTVDPRARIGALAGPAYWLLALPALGLVLLGVNALASPPGAPVRLFAIVAIAQALSLLALGTDLERGLLALPGWWADDMPWRAALDLASAAATLHLVALHPLRLRRAGALAAAGWALAALAVAAAFVG